MISDWVATIFTVILVAIGLFIIWSVKMRHLPLIHKLYLGIAVSFGVWLAALLCMKYTDPANTAGENAAFGLGNFAGAFPDQSDRLDEPDSPFAVPGVFRGQK